MIAIKNMEMPKGCVSCDFCTDDWFCKIQNKYINNFVPNDNNRHPNCPLVEIEERKVGKILICDKYRLPMYECLGCGKPVMKFWEYCPHCGNNIGERKDESNN